MINNSSMSKATGYGLRPGFNSWYQHWAFTFRKLYHSASSQKSTKCSLLVLKADRDIKLCSLSVKPNNKYNYLHTAYIAITHHINTTTQWLILLLHILNVLGSYLGLETSWLDFLCLSQSSRQMSRQFLNRDCDSFHMLSNSWFTSNPVTWCYITLSTKTWLNKPIVKKTKYDSAVTQTKLITVGMLVMYS